MVKVIKEWKPEEKKEMNKKVFKTLSFMECLTQKFNTERMIPLFLLAMGDSYSIMVKDKLAHKDLTRTDLKQISRFAERLDLSVEIDVTQPFAIGILSDKEDNLIKIREVNVCNSNDEIVKRRLHLIKFKDLRKVLP